MLTPLMAQRKLSLITAAAGTTQVILAICHLPGMPCPLLQVTGVPCPGCGVSRGCAALLTGHWADYLRWHAFAPLFLVAIVLFAAAGLLPRRPRDRFILALETVERRTGLARMLLFLFFLYWLGRMLYAPHAFASLMMG